MRFLVIVFFLVIRPVQAEESGFTEYEIKAAFLFNFVKFIDWPPEMFPDPRSPIVMGILGEDPFGEVLDLAVHDEKVQNREVIIRRFADAQSAKECHILFIGGSQKDRLEQVFRQLGSTRMVTVGDVEGFLEQGGTINFYVEDKKCRFEINAEVLRKTKIKVSAQLLRVARIIHPSSLE